MPVETVAEAPARNTRTPLVPTAETVELEAERARWPKGREKSRSELARIIEQHTTWIQSKGARGVRGDLSYVNLIWLKADSFWFPDGNLRGVRFMGSSLKEATLSGADLRGASLNDCDLRDASFWDADLRGAYLRSSKLAGARMDNADLRGAFMEGAQLEAEDKSAEELEAEREELRKLLGASRKQDVDVEPRRPAVSLNGATLRDAVLTDARLEGVAGLRADSLAGTILTNARIPADIARFELLETVANVSKSASAAHLTMIGACAYSMLTLATSDLTQLSGSAALTKLPILGTDIPISLFLVTAPVVLLAAYVYLHVYLLRMWQMLGMLPARFPDGMTLDDKAYPWLMTSLVRLYVPRLAGERQPLWWLPVAISIATGWTLAPLTIFLFLLPFLVSGYLLQAVFIATVFAASIGLSISTMRLTRGYLRGDRSAAPQRTLSDMSAAQQDSGPAAS